MGDFAEQEVKRGASGRLDYFVNTESVVPAT